MITPILDKLKEQNILSIEKTDLGFVITEQCDLYYELVLSKEALISLSEEIKQVAETKS